jgi:hypothetical protein
VLILPHAIALSPDEARLIRRFAAGGGTVIADVQPGVFDAHSRRRAQPSVPADTFRLMTPKDLQLDIAPKLQVAAPGNDVTVHLWRHGGETIVAVQRDYAAGSEPETVVVTLPTAGTVFDLRKGQSLGRLDRIPLTLDPVYPALLSITP